MQTVIVLLNPGKLKNPDMDLRYYVPKQIEKISGDEIENCEWRGLNCYKI